MSASAVHVLLLQRARDVDHAQKAWRRMQAWTPSRDPRELEQQVNDALRLADGDQVDNQWERERIRYEEEVKSIRKNRNA